LKEEALDRILCRTRFGGDYGPVVRQTRAWKNEWMNALSNLLCTEGYAPEFWKKFSLIEAEPHRQLIHEIYPLDWIIKPEVCLIS
jgi:hypothetical protein